MTRSRGGAKFLLVLVALAMLAGSAMAAELKHDPVTSAVKVICLNAADQPVAGGSGVVVGNVAGKALVITNRHVLEAGVRYAVEAGTERHPARSVGVDRIADLGGLVVAAELPAAPIAVDVPEKGTPVKLYGFPAATQGKLSIKTGKADGHTWSSVDGRPWAYQFRTTFVSQSGDSGGGVFDPLGRVCAINWGHDDKRSECASLADLRRFVKDHGYPVAEPAPRANPPAVEAETSTAKPVLLVFTGRGCRYCQQMDRNTWPDKAVSAAASKYDVRRVTVDSSDWAALARKHEVEGIPAMIVLHGGKEAARRTGYVPKAEMAEWLRSHQSP